MTSSRNPRGGARFPQLECAEILREARIAMDTGLFSSYYTLPGTDVFFRRHSPACKPYVSGWNDRKSSSKIKFQQVRDKCHTHFVVRCRGES